MSVVIGIDPHKGSHAAAAVNDELAVAEVKVEASKRQVRELLAWAERFPVRRWATDAQPCATCDRHRPAPPARHPRPSLP